MSTSAENKQKPKTKTSFGEIKDSSRLNSKLSVASVACRICYDNDRNEELIAPCQCKGTVAFIHRSCLETWLSESGTTTCELCHERFKTERTPKYTTTHSIWVWLVNGPRAAGQGVRGDIVTCTVITPLAIVITYICLYSSEYYNNQSKFSMLPAARWTSVSLLLMIGIMLIGYYLWVYAVIRLHARMWYNWWQRSCVVRYIDPSMMSIRTRPEEMTVLVPNNTPNVLTDIEAGEGEFAIEVETQINPDEFENVRENEKIIVKDSDSDVTPINESFVQIINETMETSEKSQKKRKTFNKDAQCMTSQKDENEDIEMTENIVIEIDKPCSSSVIDLK